MGLQNKGDKSRTKDGQKCDKSRTKKGQKVLKKVTGSSISKEGTRAGLNTTRQCFVYNKHDGNKVKK